MLYELHEVNSFQEDTLDNASQEDTSVSEERNNSAEDGVAMAIMMNARMLSVQAINFTYEYYRQKNFQFFSFDILNLLL